MLNIFMFLIFVSSSALAESPIETESNTQEIVKKHKLKFQMEAYDGIEDAEKLRKFFCQYLKSELEHSELGIKTYNIYQSHLALERSQKSLEEIVSAQKNNENWFLRLLSPVNNGKIDENIKKQAVEMANTNIENADNRLSKSLADFSFSFLKFAQIKAPDQSFFPDQLTVEVVSRSKINDEQKELTIRLNYPHLFFQKTSPIEVKLIEGYNKSISQPILKMKNVRYQDGWWWC